MISQSGAYSRLVRPGAELAFRQEQIPQPGCARLRLQLVEDRGNLAPARRPFVLGVQLVLIWIDMLFHEGEELLLQSLRLR